MQNYTCIHDRSPLALKKKTKNASQPAMHELLLFCTVDREKGTPVCSGGAVWWLGLGDNSKKMAWMDGYL